MAYDTQESSIESGAPVELFECSVGSFTGRYTSSELQITVASYTWTPEVIRRGRVARTNDDKEDRVQISLPSSNEFASKFLLIAPGNQATITIRRVHRGDSEVITYFKGLVHGIGFSEDGYEAIFQVLPITSVRSQKMPRFTYQNLCNYTLFDRHCKVIEGSFSNLLTVTAVSGSTITIPGAGALGADYFENGFVEYNGEFRLIIAQSTDIVTLIVPFNTTPLGQTLNCRAGCKHRLATDCQTKFSNEINYGGFKYVPTKNPFETGLD